MRKRKKINVSRLGIKHEKEDQNPFTFKSSKALSNTQIYSFFFFYFSCTCSFLLTCRSIDKSTFLIEKDGLRQGGRMNADKCMNNSGMGLRK